MDVQRYGIHDHPNEGCNPLRRLCWAWRPNARVRRHIDEKYHDIVQDSAGRGSRVKGENHSMFVIAAAMWRMARLRREAASELMFGNPVRLSLVVEPSMRIIVTWPGALRKFGVQAFRTQWPGSSNIFVTRVRRETVADRALGNPVRRPLVAEPSTREAFAKS